MTYIEYLETLLGENIDGDIRATVLRLPVLKLARFREDYHVANDQFRAFIRDYSKVEPSGQTFNELATAPMPYESRAGTAYEFRPILHGKINRTARVFGGDEGYPWQSDDNSSRVNGLKRYLLYAHCVVLPDPIWYIMQYLSNEDSYVRGVTRDNEFVAKSRTALGNFLYFLHVVKPLVESGAIAFYPQYEHGGLGFPDGYFKDQGFCDWFRSTAARSADEAFMFELTYSRVVELLFYSIRNKASCMLDDPRLVPLFDALLRYGATHLNYREAKPDPTAADERAVISKLGGLSLPTLEDLSLNEIVAVRRDSAGFSEWRQALGSAISAIEDGQSDVMTVQNAVAHAMAEGREKLQKTINKSSFLASSKDPVKKLILGSASVGAGVAAVAGSAINTAALSGAAGSAALLILYDWFSSRKDRAAKQALMKHYAIWDQ